MDLQGSLIDARLRIYPSENFITFLKSIPQDEDIPNNILKIIDINCKGNLNEGIAQPESVYLTKEDLKNIKSISDYVKTNIAPAVVKELVDSNKIEKENHEKEKSGDTPEKHVKDSVEKKVANIKKSKKKKSIDPENDKDDNVSDNNDSIDKLETQSSADDKVLDKNPGPFLLTSDIDWMYFYLQKRRSKGDDVPYLHNLMEGTSVELPKNEIIKRNPELEARCVKLRAQEQARVYRKMTKGVDNVRMRFPEDTIAYQMKQLNRHLIAIGQFIISIFAGFMFGFKGIEWTIGSLEFGFRLLLGVMCALVIALAEIYFLAKKLNEELSIPETVQLGGPVKFVDEPKFRHLPSKPLGKSGKQHQD